MLKTSAPRRPLTSKLMAVCLTIPWVTASFSPIRGAEAKEAIYFLAATSTTDAYTQAYPVALYSIGDREKLALLRQILTAEHGLIDFADDLHGRIYLVSSAANDEANMTILHEDDPDRVDSVLLKHFNDSLCWGAVAGDQLPAGVQYCPPHQIVLVLGKAVQDKPRLAPGSWALFKHLQYAGVVGVPFPPNPSGCCRIVGRNLVMPANLQTPEVVVSELPPELDASSVKGLFGGGAIVSTDRFFAFMLEPREFANMHGVTTENPGHAGPPISIYIHDKLAEKWRSLDLPTTVTGISNLPVRLFEPWLVTTVAEWRPGPDVSPGHDQERKWSNAQFPGVNAGYANQFLDLFLPGKLILDNLLDGRRVTLETGQEDSEVLAIRADGQILYRVNDSIYSARIAGNQITAPTLIVKDVDVPEVHWAFWGPAPKTAKPPVSSRRLH
jgi:hypothetical protein